MVRVIGSSKGGPNDACINADKVGVRGREYVGASDEHEH